jgi:hypothetical protein
MKIEGELQVKSQGGRGRTFQLRGLPSHMMILLRWRTNTHFHSGRCLPWTVAGPASLQSPRTTLPFRKASRIRLDLDAFSWPAAASCSFELWRAAWLAAPLHCHVLLPLLCK